MFKISKRQAKVAKALYAGLTAVSGFSVFKMVYVTAPVGIGNAVNATVGLSLISVGITFGVLDRCTKDT